MDPNPALILMAETFILWVVFDHPGVATGQVAIDPAFGGVEPGSAADGARADLHLAPSRRGAAGGQDQGRHDEGSQQSMIFFIFGRLLAAFFNPPRCP